MKNRLQEYASALDILANVLQTARQEHRAAPVVGMSGATLQRFDAALRRLNEVVASIETSE